ncbi:MAG: DNA polymerase [Streptococcaceae bacterium]|jgi:DNA polymerase V|nr:DNA polymerase [Streptococcaceae bacterium]
MVHFNYDIEPHHDIAFIDMKSFYGSVECILRGLDPLRTSLCVMSQNANSQGLILAASPVFKRIFGKSNVGHSMDLPFHPKTRKFNYKTAERLGLPTDPSYIQFIEAWAQRTILAKPQMAQYIAYNLKIQTIFSNYAAPEDIWTYSIDEGFIDLTSTLNYWVPDKHLSRAEKLDIISCMIQHDIYKETGIYSTVGMSNSNPLLAKLALDNEAKHNVSMRANWSYENIPEKVWEIPNLTDFWGIGSRTARHLQKIGIFTIKELAHANPDILRKKLKSYGVQLWFHANGIDESDVHHVYRTKTHGMGSSKALPIAYSNLGAIQLIYREKATELAKQLFNTGKMATTVSISIIYDKKEKKRSDHIQKHILATNRTQELVDVVLELLQKKYQSGAVKKIVVRYSGLVSEGGYQLSLFEDSQKVERDFKLQTALQSIENQFGPLSLMRASNLRKESLVRWEKTLIGGHSA